MENISRAQAVEVRQLQSEYIQFCTQSLRQGILLTTSYTDENQALKDMMKRKDAEQKRKESKCTSYSLHVCIKDYISNCIIN